MLSQRSAPAARAAAARARRAAAVGPRADRPPPRLAGHRAAGRSRRLAAEGAGRAPAGPRHVRRRPPRAALAAGRPVAGRRSRSARPAVDDRRLRGAAGAAAGPGAIPLRGGYLDRALQPAAALGAALARAARRPARWDRGPVEGRADAARLVRRARPAAPCAPHDVVISPGGQAALATALPRAGRARRHAAGRVADLPRRARRRAGGRAAGRARAGRRRRVRPDLLADALARTGARLVYCQPLYANPHGATLAPERRAEVLAAVAAAGAFLIEDDYARDLDHRRRSAAAAGGRRPGRPRRLPALADQVRRARPADRRDRRPRRGRRAAARRARARRLLRRRPAAAGRARVRHLARLAAPPRGAARARCASAATRCSPRSPSCCRRPSRLGPGGRPARLGRAPRRHRRRGAGRAGSPRRRDRLPRPPWYAAEPPRPHLRLTARCRSRPWPCRRLAPCVGGVGRGGCAAGWAGTMSTGNVGLSPARRSIPTLPMPWMFNVGMPADPRDDPDVMHA